VVVRWNDGNFEVFIDAAIKNSESIADFTCPRAQPQGLRRAGIQFYRALATQN
jgi:hypothetical protein